MTLIRAPMPQRLLFTPSVRKTIQFFEFPPSLRQKVGMSLLLITRISISPSLSKSPKAVPHPTLLGTLRMPTTSETSLNALPSMFRIM